MSGRLGLGDLFTQLENIFFEIKNHSGVQAILNSSVNAIADVPGSVLEVTTNPVGAAIEAVSSVVAEIEGVSNTGTSTNTTTDENGNTTTTTQETSTVNAAATVTVPNTNTH